MIWKKRPTETNIAALSSNLGGYLPSEWVGNITDISQLNSLTIPGKYLRYITNGVGGLPGGWGVVEVAALSGYDNYFQTVTFVNGCLYARSHPTNGEWTSFASLTSDLTPHTVSNSPTFAENIVNTDVAIRVSGKVVSGYLIFAYNSSFSGATGLQVITTNDGGLPPSVMNQQLPLICVAGTNSGKVGRVRIATDGRIQFWYSNVPGAAGETYLIPLNYLTN